MLFISLVLAVILTLIPVAGFSIATSLVTYLAIVELFLDLTSEMKSTPSVYETLDT